MCGKKKVSFWNSSDICECEYFWRGPNNARTNYGCVEARGGNREFKYMPLGGYGLIAGGDN